MKKTKQMFDELLNLEDILQRLKEGKAVRLLPNDLTIGIMQAARDNTHNTVKRIYTAAKARRNLRNPNASYEAKYIRIVRELASKDIMEQLDDYFQQFMKSPPINNLYRYQK